MDFLEELNIKETKMVVCTIKDYDDNILVLKTIKKHNPQAIILLISHSTMKGMTYYQEGADYVVLPHQI